MRVFAGARLPLSKSKLQTPYTPAGVSTAQQKKPAKDAYQLNFMKSLSQRTSAGRFESAKESIEAGGQCPATAATAISPQGSQRRTVVEAKSCGSAARGMVVIDDSVGTRPESVVKRRGSRGPLRGGDTKAPETWLSPRGLCWDRKKSSMSAALCYHKHGKIRTRGSRIGRR